MKVPTVQQALEYIKFAEQRNPGRWIDHSYNVARVAKSIADECDDLDGNVAYV